MSGAASSQSSRASIAARSVINGLVWSRARAAIVLKADGLRTQPRRASAVFPIAAVQISDGKARGSEHILNPDAARLGPFIQRGSHWICKSGGASFRAHRSTPKLPFVHDANQSANGIAYTFFLAPVPSSACFNHAQTKAWSRQHDVQRKPAPGA